MNPKIPARSVDLAALARKMESANTELLRTDTGTQAEPQIDAAEAGASRSPLSKQSWNAASKVWGSRYVTTENNSWVKKSFDKHAVTAADLSNLKNQALRVLHGIVPPGAKEVPRELLADLAGHVDRYWKETFGERNQLLPAQRNAMVAFIQKAIDELE